MRELGMREWLALDRSNPAPTFFARPAWARALADTYPSLIPSPIRTSNDVLVPTMKTRTPLPVRDHVAFPLGGYTAFLNDRNCSVDAAAATRALAEISGALHHVRIISWPLGESPQAPTASSTTTYETAAIDCSNGFDAALSNVRGVTRRMAGQAERRGVVVERATAAELDVYFDILREASIGWGLARPPISRQLLEAVFHYGGDDAQLWFARLDGVAIGGGVILFGNDELFFWSAAMRRDYSRHRPSNALNLRLIRAACERGVRWYNLGASEGLEGVARFKSDLGAESIEYREISIVHPAFSLYQRFRNRVRPKRSA